MTPDEVRAVVRRALEDMWCGCYDTSSMEYSDAYPCPKCSLAELAAELEREVAA